MIASLQAHYGFSRMPFTASVPVQDLYASAARKEAVARLRWLISARGLGVLTGEVGAGKTVALRAAADGLDASRSTLIYLPNPQVGVRGIHGTLATALGQAPRFHHATLIPQVESALAAEAGERNRNVILAIDEAHLLTGDQLEAVRMLTNHDLDSGSPLTVLLTGRSDTLFSDDAVRAIHTCARGMPRAVNRLATTALLAACTAGKTIADESAARTAIAEDTATD